MGCHLSSQAKNSPDHQSVGSKNKIDPPPPPPTDPRLPLTTRQLFSITKSWKGISREIQPTGVLMFIRLFKENEELLHVFEKFRTFKIGDGGETTVNEELSEHAAVVMNTLHEAMEVLGDVDSLYEYLGSIASIHCKIHGFKSQYFWKMEIPFLSAVQHILGDRYTENMEEIYKITIHFLLQTLVDRFNKLRSDCEDNKCDANEKDSYNRH